MAAYPDHFPKKVDFSKFEYFRVAKKDLAEFSLLQGEIISCAKSKKTIPQEKINKYLSLMTNLKDAEFRQKLMNYIDGHEIIEEHFEETNKDYIFKGELRLFNNQELEFIDEADERHESIVKLSPDDIRINQGVIVQIKLKDDISIDKKKFKDLVWFPRYEDFGSMIFHILELLFEKDQEKSFDKDSCIEFIFEELVKYRKDSMSESQKALYPAYKIAVLSGFITHNIMNFTLSKKSDLRNRDYHQAVRNALKKLEAKNPDIFKDLPK